MFEFLKLYKNFILISGILPTLLYAPYANASQAEDIHICVNAGAKHANLQLNELTAEYESNFISDNVVIWPGIKCDIRFGGVYNLEINGQNYVYRGFAGEHLYNLNAAFEAATASTIDRLKSRISLLEGRMEFTTKELQGENASPETAFEYIKKGLEEPIQLNDILSDLRTSTDRLTKSNSLEKSKRDTKKTNKSDNSEQQTPKARPTSDSTPSTYYVNTRSLKERLSPSLKGKVTNVIYSGQKVEVYENVDGWARVSKYYDGAVEGVSGQVARWVSLQHLSTTRPAEPITAVNSAVGEAIKKSDDYDLYQKVFEAATQQLIDSKQCNLEELKEYGGWVRSATQKPKLIFFTYCGGSHRDNRIYLDAETGSVFR